MIDSCRPRKLEPGIAATYSIPRLFMTSTMKSLTQVDCVISSSAGGALPRSPLEGGTAGTLGGRGGGAGGVCATAATGAATAAEPARATPLRKPPRPTDPSLELFATPFSPVPKLI